MTTEERLEKIERDIERLWIVLVEGRCPECECFIRGYCSPRIHESAWDELQADSDINLINGHAQGCSSHLRIP